MSTSSSSSGSCRGAIVGLHAHAGFCFFSDNSSVAVTNSSTAAVACYVAHTLAACGMRGHVTCGI
eukprot:scaffold4549_cov136-Isochrysis_galbana.AAC.7